MTNTYAPTAATYSSPLADTALLVGRIMLVVIFVFSGFGKFMDLGGTAAAIASKNLPMPYLLAIAAATTELVGGLLIAIGWGTRLVAPALAVFTMIAAYFFHAYWLEPADAQTNDMIHFMKNVAISGGFLMLAGSGPGRYSVDGRV